MSIQWKDVNVVGVDYAQAEKYTSRGLQSM